MSDLPQPAADHIWSSAILLPGRRKGDIKPEQTWNMGADRWTFRAA